MGKSKRKVPGINASSTADISFILLIFFLVVTSMNSNFGLPVMLPNPPEEKDLQDPPEVIPDMARRWKDGAQVVYGKRKKRDGETFFKKFTASVYYKSINKLTKGMVLRDTALPSFLQPSSYGT